MDLAALRRKIDAIDRALLARLNARARLAAQVGGVKRRQGAPIHVPRREEEIYARLAARNRGPLPAAAVRAIFREIISASTALQKQLVVAFPAAGGAPARAAAREYFGAGAAYRPCARGAAALTAVAGGAADYGVTPAGDAPKALAKHGLTVVAEITPPADLAGRGRALPRFVVVARGDQAAAARAGQ